MLRVFITRLICIHSWRWGPPDKNCPWYPYGEDGIERFICNKCDKQKYEYLSKMGYLFNKESKRWVQTKSNTE